MKTHKNIQKILDRTDLAPEYRKSVEDADNADKMSRCFHGHNSGFVMNRQYSFDSAHADLLKCGITEINGMPTDIWLARFLREWGNITNPR